jgi:hypothetical protein
MSKLDTPMTRWYWQQVGNTLTEEFCAVRRDFAEIVLATSNRIGIYGTSSTVNVSTSL